MPCCRLLCCAWPCSAGSGVTPFSRATCLLLEVSNVRAPSAEADYRSAITFHIFLFPYRSPRPLSALALLLRFSVFTCLPLEAGTVRNPSINADHQPAITFFNIYFYFLIGLLVLFPPGLALLLRFSVSTCLPF